MGTTLHMDSYALGRRRFLAATFDASGRLRASLRTHTIGREETVAPHPQLPIELLLSPGGLWLCRVGRPARLLATGDDASLRRAPP
jgi:hypothetical protein